MDFQTSDEVAALIEAAGGFAKLAKTMGLNGHNARQRVYNWKTAGAIPEMVVRAYRPLFRKIIARAKKTEAQHHERTHAAEA